jgi:hypothetical protein
VAAPAESKERKGKVSAKKKLANLIKGKAAKFSSQPKDKILPAALRAEPPIEPERLDD